MIVELANSVSSHAEISKMLPYQNTLFPAPATKHRIHQSQRKYNSWTKTDASHESITENFVQTISTLRRLYFEQTTPRSHRVGIHEQCGGFSMDQEEQANPE